MTKRVYMSEISPWWTIERQREALADVLPGAAVFIDLLDRRQRRAHRISDLVNRAQLLRPTTRLNAETVYVATLAALAWSEDDLRSVLACIEARGGVLVAIDSGSPPDVVEAWKAARTVSRLEGAAKRGAVVSAAKRRAVSDAAIELHVRPYWHLKEPPIHTLCVQAGLSVNTVVARLGPRSRAQWEHQSKEAHRAARADKRKEAQGKMKDYSFTRHEGKDGTWVATLEGRGLPLPIGEFASEEEVKRWIATESEEWLKRRYEKRKS